MQKRIVWLAMVLLLLSLGAGTVQAQREIPDMDTTLARAAARGFLASLSRPELAGLQSFYLLEQAAQSGLVDQLGTVEQFDLTGGEWVSPVSYRATAVIQPGNREIALYVGKYSGRWRVEGLDLPVEAPAPAQSPAATAAGPAAVPDNGPGRLVFQTRSGGDIYTINADGTGLRRLTHGLDPALSPDGTRVAFARWEPRYELFVINIDGTGEQALTHGWRQIKSPTWTADGRQIIFSWQNGGRLDTETHRINLEKAALSGEPVRIPDNARDIKVEYGILSYTIPPDAYWSLKAIDLSTGTLADLPAELHSVGPVAHPVQADLLVYRGNRGLTLHHLDTGQEQVITTDGRDHTPALSPDGSRIAVSYWQDDHWEIHVLNADGSGRQRLTSTPLTVLVERRQPVQKLVDGKVRYVAPEQTAWNNAAPVWSPDGRKIAFLTDRTGLWELWIMNADGSGQRPMFPNGALDGLSFSFNGAEERVISWR